MKASLDQTTLRASTIYVQPLLIRLDGITAGDYLAWVREPEPPALDHGLRSVEISADPLGELVNIELVWAGQPRTTLSAAAVAAGFALIPEVVAVHSATCTADRHRAPSGRARMPTRSHSLSPSERPPDTRDARPASHPKMTKRK
jgi:hypothetical protein